MSCSKALREKFTERLKDRVKFDEPLAPYVAYRIGGPADILVFPTEERELEWIANTAKEERLPLTIIGTGTNLLVSDLGIRGITVSLQAMKRQILPLETVDEITYVQASGGVEKPDLLEWAVQNGLGGLEFSSGVPGTLGGGIFMNAGTKYGCYGDILERLCLFSFEKGSQIYEKDQIQFGYRTQSLVRNSLVLWIVVKLHRDNQERLRAEVDRIIAERAEKQPLDFPSCGSTFKNPPGHSAGRLIEKSGLKGLTIGGAQISEKHANFILNKGSAKAKDILALIGIIKRTVQEKFGVALECEVILLGELQDDQNEFSSTASLLEARPSL